MDLSKNTVSVANNDYSMKLSASQKESFANASYMIFQKNGNDYSLIYQSDDTTLDNNGKLKANFDGKIMMYSNSKNKTKRPIFVEQKSKNVYNANIVVKDSINHSAVATIETSSNKGSIVNVVGKSDDDRELLPSMTILKLEDYSELTFETNKYRLLDNSGYFAKDWESTATAQSYQTTPSDYQLVLQNVPKGKGYYFAFEVRDISNEITYTKPVEIK